MPWCPQCKNEFQEGYTLCSDCKVDLVDELTTEKEYVPFFQAEQKAVAEKLLNYFNYSGLKSVIRYQEEYEVFVLYVPDGQMKQAKKLYQAFYFVEREQHEKQLQAQNSEEVREAPDPMEIDSMDTNSTESSSIEADSTKLDAKATDSDPIESKDTTDENYINEGVEVSPLENENNTNSADHADITESFQSGRALYSDSWNKEEESKDIEADNEEEEDIEEDSSIKASAYVMKEDQYKDYNSTVWIFLLMGIAGIIFVILNLIGTLTYLNGPFPNTVMGALFLFFIYIAISTNQRAKKIQAEIADEKQLTEQINEWLKEHLTKDYMTSLQDDTLSDELIYIQMTDHMKEQLMIEFGQQNEGYLDQLIEDYYSANIEGQ